MFKMMNSTCGKHLLQVNSKRLVRARLVTLLEYRILPNQASHTWSRILFFPKPGPVTYQNLKTTKKEIKNGVEQTNNQLRILGKEIKDTTVDFGDSKQGLHKFGITPSVAHQNDIKPTIDGEWQGNYNAPGAKPWLVRDNEKAVGSGYTLPSSIPRVASESSRSQPLRHADLIVIE
ncbi:hypothetical protein BGZ60DRAFT_518666 [Tricladium varicosporioides]|nr:hypothetical protein BGZ60DRAFT_518666 [Hymenoscyphus varicosporioides]